MDFRKLAIEARGRLEKAARRFFAAAPENPGEIPFPRRSIRPSEPECRENSVRRRRRGAAWASSALAWAGRAAEAAANRPTLAGSVAVGAVVALAGWAALQKYTQIPLENVEIVRADPLVDVDLAYNALADFRDISYFGVSEKAVLRAISAAQPNVASVSLDRSFPDRLAVTVASVPAAFRTDQGGKPAVVTANGILVLRAPVAPLPELRVLGGSRDAAAASNYRRVLSLEDAGKASALLAELKAQFPASPAGRVSFFPLERELHAEVGSGTVLILDADAPFSRALSLVRIYAEKKGDPLRPGKWSYADLRIPGKIFSCPASRPADCRKNLVAVYGDAYAEAKKPAAPAVRP